PGFAGGIPAATSVAVDVAVAGAALFGQVERVYPVEIDGEAQWHILRAFPGNGGKLKAERDLDFKDRVPLFLDWAMLRIHHARLGGTVPAVRLALLVDDEQPAWAGALNAWDEDFGRASVSERERLLADLEQRVAQLVQWWMQAQGQPRWYFPKSAWKAIQPTIHSPRGVAAGEDLDGEGAAGPANIDSTWVATHAGGVGERDYAPGYSRLLTGSVDFTHGSEALRELHDFGLSLSRCLDLGAGFEGLNTGPANPGEVTA